MKFNWTAVGILALSLVGCGDAPMATVAKKPATTQAAPTPPPSPSNQAIARQMANKTVAAFAALKTFDGIAQTMEVDPKDGEVYRSEVDVMFKAPSKFRLTVRPGFDMAGLKLSFDDGSDHVEVRMAGVLGVAKIKLGADDPKAKTSRGHSIMKVSEKGILTRLGNPKGQVAYIGDSAIEGKPTNVLSLTGSGVMLEGVTEERIHIDKATSLPIRGEMLNGRQVIFSSTIKNLRPNAPVSDDVFDI